MTYLFFYTQNCIYKSLDLFVVTKSQLVYVTKRL